MYIPNYIPNYILEGCQWQWQSVNQHDVSDNRVFVSIYIRRTPFFWHTELSYLIQRVSVRRIYLSECSHIDTSYEYIYVLYRNMVWAMIWSDFVYLFIRRLFVSECSISIRRICLGAKPDLSSYSAKERPNTYSWAFHEPWLCAVSECFHTTYDEMLCLNALLSKRRISVRRIYDNSVCLKGVYKTFSDQAKAGFCHVDLHLAIVPSTAQECN